MTIRPEKVAFAQLTSQFEPLSPLRKSITSVQTLPSSVGLPVHHRSSSYALMVSELPKMRTIPVSIELPKDKHREAIASIVRFFQEEREEEIGTIAAGGLLRFFLEEIGPSIYNQAVAEVQQRMEMHVADLDIDFHEKEFQFWPKSNR